MIKDTNRLTLRVSVIRVDQISRYFYDKMGAPGGQGKSIGNGLVVDIEADVVVEAGCAYTAS